MVCGSVTSFTAWPHMGGAPSSTGKGGEGVVLATQMLLLCSSVHLSGG